jgi:PE family
MSFVSTQPEALTAAAGSLQGISSAMSAQNAAAAAPTTGVVLAAADEVSVLTAAQFAAHAQMYQAVSAQAAAVHEMFVNTRAPAPVRMRPPRPPTRSRPAEQPAVKRL